MTRIRPGRMPTRRRVIRIRRGRITTRPRVRAISEARMRISTLLTMISRPVATGATYDRSALARERSSRDRAAGSVVRDESAAARLRTAEECDRAATLRDRGAQGRDELARLHDPKTPPVNAPRRCGTGWNPQTT
jgi:hypothetical protein